MRTEDGHIIGKCLNGDPVAFGFLVDKYKASVYAYAYSRLGNFHDAEDIAQEVFIKAYKNLRSLKSYDSFLAWLYSIATNLCKNWNRAQSRRPDNEFIEDKDPDVLDNSSIYSYREESLMENLRDALDLLPDMYRQALILHYLGGMSSREIAGFVGASPATVRKRLSRARSQLREEMLSEMEESFDSQKLQAIFTFRIVEAVKDIKIRPMPRVAGLPWGLSLAAGIIVAVLTLNPHISIVNSAFINSGSPLSAEARILTTGEIPVDIMEISRVSALASNQEDGEDAGLEVFDLSDAALVVSQGEGDTWTKKADMPTARAWLSTGVVDGKIYAIGGCIGISTHTSVVEEYDPVINAWTQKADMPTVRDQLSISVVNGKIYAIGGFDEGKTLGSVEEYDPVIDKWAERADMPTARQSLSTSVVNGKIYAIGGWNVNLGIPLSTVEEYDPERHTWTKKSDMPTARGFLSTSVVNGKIYAIGGSNRRRGSNDFEGIPVVEEYDPVMDTWISKADMPTARWGLSVSTVGDRIFAMGGGHRMVPFAAVEEYNPATNTWRERADMPDARGLHSTSVVNGRIYVVGGSESWADMFLQTVEEYDPGFVPGESVRADGKFWLPWGKVK